MFTLIPVTKHFSVPAILTIENPNFARWYSSGINRALYGNCQGEELYADTYLIENVHRSLKFDWYKRLGSEHLLSRGFYLGMIHGGCLDPSTRQLRRTETIVRITNQDFWEGYQAGRQDPWEVSDTEFMMLLRAYALSQLVYQTIPYGFGMLIGAIIPVTSPVTAF
jgi:hypothetical protein